MSKNRLKFRIWRERYKRFLGQTPCPGLDEFVSDLHPFEENDIIEQSTGLKDKNGKLVFEGDILKVEGGLWEVCWSNTLASFMLDDYSYDENGQYTGSGNLETIHADEIQEMEVVGNIHEGVKE